MTSVTEQYEAYPYPARDPADEKRRLIVGSPSTPIEIDHFIFGGQRDWSKPIKILVAGGGTGDALIQMAQILTTLKKPYEITYLDLSVAARNIAEARAKMRGLTGITFVTGSLLDAPDHGTFDYIDCCGVLHHLPDPDAGFGALRAALAVGGGIGMMVYAPLGRSGVYPLQAAFGTLFDGMPAVEKLAAARALFQKVPAEHPFRANNLLGDHNASDAGFFDLLLHSQDRAYTVTDLLAAIDQADLELVSFLQPGLYNLSRLTPVPAHLSAAQSMAVAEQLRGTMKTHVCYVTAKGAGKHPADGTKMTAVPHLLGAPAAKIAQRVAAGKGLNLTVANEKMNLMLPRETAVVIEMVNGKRNLADIARARKLDPVRFSKLWKLVDTAFGDWGLIYYSAIQK